MRRESVMNLFDSLKTYGTVMFGYLATMFDWACGAVQKVTVILVFVSLVVRIIHDAPKAMESIRKLRKKKV